MLQPKSSGKLTLGKALGDSCAKSDKPRSHVPCHELWGDNSGFYMLSRIVESAEDEWDAKH